MKKWLFLCIVLLVIVFRFYLKEGLPGHNPSITEHTSEISASAEDSVTIRIDKAQIHQGNLILVNKNYRVHTNGVSTDIVSLSEHDELRQGFTLLDQSIELSRSVTERFSELTEAADRVGVEHFRISSGYRDQAEQRKLYREKGSDYALPAGHSEHNTGLSLDIGSSLGEIAHSPEGDWLQANACHYGFILRYPEDKTNITGIKYEAWHFRYVGLPHSLLMKEKNLVLEEYLADLKQQKRLKVTVEGRKYLILYVPGSELDSVQLPAGHPYEISGNNVDGVIVTVELSKWGKR
ncbi:M15 family metallopeptidase [Paenibacillus sp. P46E]|uniref:M15 family metallopeptidase n=1 Tax=Paenibacillus sp. P46E TaxID=1349436 RepID=UPI00093BDCBC|nr:M15 family metallopeptidase [Paenibacillus sp. P46E]OKP94964.1 D-Ala-D-Ala carboxypeptidase VanY [Paenibacillus sp. P46E]